MPDFALFIVRFILFACLHSLCATLRSKQIFSRGAGSEPRPYRLIYNLGSLGMFVWVMAAYRSSPVLYFAPGIWSLVMYAVQVVLAGSIFQCIRQTGAGEFLGFSQLSPGPARSKKLITGGFYAHMRHPLYFYTTLFLLLNPVMTAQWLILTLLSVTYFIVGGLIEERRLLVTFGDEYRDYRQRVPFLIPSLTRVTQGRPAQHAASRFEDHIR